MLVEDVLHNIQRLDSSKNSYNDCHNTKHTMNSLLIIKQKKNTCII